MSVEYNIQALSQTNDGYRVSIVQSGLGRRTLVFTTGASVGNYVALRISSRPTATAGLYFIADNFTFKKHQGVNMVTAHATDFNSATMSGVNIEDNGQLWKPANNTITTLSLTGTTDKKIQVNCTNVNDSKLITDIPVEGGKRYLLKFSTTQNVNDKRLLLQLSVRTGGGPWTITDQRGFFYLNSGDNQLNFTAPAGADELRVEFTRNGTNTVADGLDVPYTIDNFSLQRVDVVTSTRAMVCDSSNAEGRGIYRFGFNGKENDNEVKGLGGQVDYSERQYDPRIGRWLAIDNLFKDYPFASPYNFALNTPIQAKDPDGERVFFVNGYYNTGDGWMKDWFGLKKWLAKKIIGTQGGRKYWGQKFVQRAQSYFKDWTSMRDNINFVDGRGSMFSNGKDRYEAGYEYAKANFAQLTDGMVKGETIKMVSHSMGGAYAEGMIKYFEEEGTYKVEKVLHLSIADPDEFKMSEKPMTIQLNYHQDVVLAYKNGDNEYFNEGADIAGTAEESDARYSHAKTKFDPHVFCVAEDLENVQMVEVPQRSNHYVLSEYDKKFTPTGIKNGSHFSEVIKQNGADKKKSKFVETLASSIPSPEYKKN